MKQTARLFALLAALAALSFAIGCQENAAPAGGPSPEELKKAEAAHQSAPASYASQREAQKEGK